MSDLSQHIQQTPLADTHEHTEKESRFIEDGPDVLQDLFEYYPQTDLIVAGASIQAVRDLVDAHNPDIQARWESVRQAWQYCRYTGYGEAISIVAREIYGMEEITTRGIEAAEGILRKYRKPGGMRHILETMANINHVQIDDFSWTCLPDPAGPDFFFYDISWALHSSGMIDPQALYSETQVDVVDLDTLQQAYEKIFARYAPFAIAVKSDYAYNRTLFWQERDPSDVDKILQKQLTGRMLSKAERLCLGDWSLSRGIELADRYQLPFKIHTGLLYDHSLMDINKVNPALLSTLLVRHKNARFVLMHTGYPFSQELLGLAKHFPSVSVDLCWAWAIDAYNTYEFLRRAIHSIPTNKIFIFGGDCHWPFQTLGYARQARAWLTHTLNAEILDSFLNEAQAMNIASQVMCQNQIAYFRLAEKRAATRINEKR